MFIRILELLQNCVSGEHSPKSSSDVLSDISDGQILKNNYLFFSKSIMCQVSSIPGCL